MIAAYSEKGKYPLPQTILNQAPINMRKHVEPPLDASDIVCGSSALWWPQTVKPEDKLWKVVAEGGKSIFPPNFVASAAIKKDIEEKTPLAWWARFEEGKFGEIRPFTIMTTSMGVTNIKVILNLFITYNTAYISFTESACF